MKKKNDHDNQKFTIEETILIERLRSFHVPAMAKEYKRLIQIPIRSFCLSRSGSPLS